MSRTHGKKIGSNFALPKCLKKSNFHSLAIFDFSTACISKHYLVKALIIKVTGKGKDMPSLSPISVA